MTDSVQISLLIGLFT